MGLTKGLPGFSRAAGRSCRANARMPAERISPGCVEGQSGQAVVELAVAFPVLIVVAVVAVNALLFFSECAAFDRAACDAVRVHAASPAYGQDAQQSRALVADTLADAFDRPYLESRVAVEEAVGGHVSFVAELEFSPTLFGLGFRSEVLGVGLPRLHHRVAFAVDAYKPGMLL